MENKINLYGKQSFVISTEDMLEIVKKYYFEKFSVSSVIAKPSSYEIHHHTGDDHELLTRIPDLDMPLIDFLKKYSVQKKGLIRISSNLSWILSKTYEEIDYFNIRAVDLLFCKFNLGKLRHYGETSHQILVDAYTNASINTNKYPIFTRVKGEGLQPIEE
jgi:hypothetical protein